MFDVCIDPMFVKPKDFRDPADKIKGKLNKIPKEKRAATDIDSGGVYVAASAAIFYIWAHAAAKNGKEVLKPWLSELEICSVEQGTYNKPEFEWGSHLRYMEWYNFLHTKSGSQAHKSCQ